MDAILITNCTFTKKLCDLNRQYFLAYNSNSAFHDIVIIYPSCMHKSFQTTICKCEFLEIDLVPH